MRGGWVRAMPPSIDWGELDAQGFTILRGFAPPTLTSRARALIDSILGPCPVERCDAFLGATNTGAERSSDGVVRWSPPEPRPPRIDSKDYRHSIRHPIRDPLMAEPVADCRDIHRQLLRAGDGHGLQLHQQMLHRADPVDPETTPAGPLGWHLDNAYLPRHTEAQPRQVWQPDPCRSKAQRGPSARP